MPEALAGLVEQLRKMRLVDRWAILAKLDTEERNALLALINARRPQTQARAQRYDFQQYSPAVAKRLAEILIKRNGAGAGAATITALRELTAVRPEVTQ